MDSRDGFGASNVCGLDYIPKEGADNYSNIPILVRCDPTYLFDEQPRQQRSYG